MPDELSSDMYLASGLITFVRREGNKVFVRALLPDEDPDPAKPATIRAGDRVVFDVGALSIAVENLDAPAVAARGGYAPVAGTVWRCNQVLLRTHPENLRRRLFELARKLDATFILWSSVMDLAEEENSELQPVTKLHLGLNALALTEELFVPLAKSLRIIRELSDACSLDIPDTLQDVGDGIIKLRNKAQHTQLKQQDRVLARGIFLRMLTGEQVNLPGGSSTSLTGLVDILKEGRALVLDVVRNAEYCSQSAPPG